MRCIAALSLDETACFRFAVFLRCFVDDHVETVEGAKASYTLMLCAEVLEDEPNELRHPRYPSVFHLWAVSILAEHNFVVTVGGRRRNNGTWSLEQPGHDLVDAPAGDAGHNELPPLEPVRMLLFIRLHREVPPDDESPSSHSSSSSSSSTSS
eukprot:gnl/TRDRNA2_/TRDRNA2_160044_c0_seq1.p1 gnl/TRDRNA2_/TRDRNA2_160044_c0~~gnl/TRDRNA2_/TRDRNA2_160044_c0_seq1.p1  ORF type:complete len:153 (-),score=19.52 gnl/TRDRNA2_/TRDRNA2_160044_c0_seq1:105-563(-)